MTFDLLKSMPPRSVQSERCFLSDHQAGFYLWDCVFRLTSFLKSTLRIGHFRSVDSSYVVNPHE